MSNLTLTRDLCGLDLFQRTEDGYFNVGLLFRAYNDKNGTNKRFDVFVKSNYPLMREIYKDENKCYETGEDTPPVIALKWEKMDRLADHKDCQDGQGRVYVAKYHNGLVKIGCSLDVSRRLSDLDESPYNNNSEIVESVCSRPLWDYYSVENKLHKLFDHARKKGTELFDLTIDDVVGLTDGVIICQDDPFCKIDALSYRYCVNAKRGVNSDGSIWVHPILLLPVLSFLDDRLFVKCLSDIDWTAM